MSFSLPQILLLVASYLSVLFAIAHLAEREIIPRAISNHPLTYVLSLGVFAGAMANETLHFVNAVARDRPVLVTPEEARQVMEVYIAADLSAERNEPVRLPLQEPST